MAKPLFLDPEQFDLVQKDIINNGFLRNRNCVVSGCAGSGKSCIAMAIFVSLCLRNRRPVIVTKQRALVNTYMDELLHLCDSRARSYVVAHHDCDRLEWYSQSKVVNTYAKGVDMGLFLEDATDVLVDEAQDFTRGEIDAIVSYFPNLRSIHFFGDDNQQIYEGAFGQSSQVDMDELVAVAAQVGSRQTYRRSLFNNYRLPVPAAKFVDRVEGPEGRLSAQCFGEGSEKPYLLHYNSAAEAVASVCDIVRVRGANTRHYRAAVISYQCGTCEVVYNVLCERSGCHAARVRGALQYGVSNYKLPEGPKTLEQDEFRNANAISTTAFSSKGLQYDDVFVLVDDFTGWKGAWTPELLNVLHVALTRTQGGLFVCCSNRSSVRPFSHVPDALCQTRLRAA